MSIRKGYLYALLLAVGLFLWSEVAGRWQEPPAQEAPIVVERETITPWTSSEAFYECSLKAQELALTLDSVYTAGDDRQGSLVFTGTRDDLQAFYTWLEEEGRFRSILSFQLNSEDEAASWLSVSYQL